MDHSFETAGLQITNTRITAGEEMAPEILSTASFFGLGARLGDTMVTLAQWAEHATSARTRG